MTQFDPNLHPTLFPVVSLREVARVMPVIAQTIAQHPLNRSVVDLVFPMFEREDLSKKFDYRFWHGGDRCEREHPVYYILYKPMREDLRVDGEVIAETLNGVHFWFSVPEGGGRLHDEDARFLALARRIEALDAAGERVPNPIVWVPPTIPDPSERWYEQIGWSQSDGAIAYIPADTTARTLMIHVQTRSIVGEDSQHNPVHSIVFDVPEKAPW